MVPVNFTFPSGIPYEVLASIHLPDNDGAVEAEAEKLAGLNADGDDFVGGCPVPYSVPAAPDGGTVGTESFDLTCAPGYVWDNELQHCVKVCPSGYHWDDTLRDCVPNTPSPIFTQTIGNLSVADTQLGIQNLRNVRVVAKRWFKIERMYTNNSGRFNSTKKFKNKVKLVVKFKNNDATIRGMRGARYWQILYPVQKKFGPLQGSGINAFTYTFNFSNDYKSKGARYWVAATAHNAVQQFKDFSVSQGTGALSSNSLKILLTNWGSSGSGSAPLFSVRWTDGLTADFITTFVATAVHPLTGGVNAFLAFAKRQIDITYSYNYSPGDLTSDKVAETIYHELAHATLYKKAGADWYKTVVDGTIQELSRPGYAQYSPYGNGQTAYSPIIAVNEGWAYHYGHFLANLKYGTSSSTLNRQGEAYEPTHLAYLENYNPNYTRDVFRWIPEGIFLDLIDDTPNEVNTAPTFLGDKAYGFTNSQLFNAINSDVRSPQAYRDRLLQQNSNRQLTQVTNLFNLYGYR